MSASRSTNITSDMNERVQLHASRFKPVISNTEHINSDNPMEAVPILPNLNNLKDVSSYLYMNGKPSGRQKRRNTDMENGTLNSIQNKEKLSFVQPIIPKPCQFEWTSYLREIDSSFAPISYFTHVPLDIRNDCMAVRSSSHMPLPSSFRPNQCMEGIDPYNESVFCALKVAEVVGRRLRLRFIGFPEKYDFWTTVDSPFLFPIGWCSQNKRALLPPKSHTERGQANFEWLAFMVKENLTAVPRHLFRVPWDSPPNDSPVHMFRIGHKLEAVDKRNPGVVCVATVKDSIGDYVLIHFDGWESNFDQWVHITSELLHPVGYCEEQELVLSVPAEWNSRPNGFTWKQYFKETNSKPVPKEAFDKISKVHASLPRLQAGQRLEAVDRRCPQLVRVANVVSVSAGFVTINYDGWPDKYNVRMESGSLDLFPAGYCHATGHPLQPPIRYESDAEFNGTGALDAQSNSSASSATGTGGCPTVGCKGYGHVKGPRYSTHQRLSGCPYSDMNLNRDFIRPHERLAGKEVTPLMADRSVEKSNETSVHSDGLAVVTSVSIDANDKTNHQNHQTLTTQGVSQSTSVNVTQSTQFRTTHQVASTAIPSTEMNGTSPLPTPSTGVSSYDVASLSATDTRKNNGTPMPLDLSVLGKDKAKETPGVNSPGGNIIRKVDIPSDCVESTRNSSASIKKSATETPEAPQTLPPASEPFLDISNQPTVAGTKRPSTSNYIKPEARPRLASIANAANEYARQQQQMFGIAGLPVKRKRGRPRKYSSLGIVHTPTCRSSVPASSGARNSMNALPLYSSTSMNKTTNIQQNVPSNTIPTISSSTMMPALSIYAPLTVGSSLSSLYSAGLLIPSTTLPATGCEMTLSSGSPAAVLANVQTTVGCTTTTKTSGVYTESANAVVPESPKGPELMDESEMNAGNLSYSQAVTTREDSSAPQTSTNSDIHNCTENCFPPWSGCETSELSNPCTVPSYFGSSNHNSFDSLRISQPVDLFPSPGFAPSGANLHLPRTDFDLMGRLVPQAGAALRASKAAGLTGPHSWSAAMVSNFVSTIPGCKQFASKFIDNEIDGAALLCLEQHDLMHVLGMKLGPAVKIAGAIHTLRRSLMSTPVSDLGQDYALAVAAATSCFTEEHSTATIGDDSIHTQNLTSTKNSDHTI